MKDINTYVVEEFYLECVHIYPVTSKNVPQTPWSYRHFLEASVKQQLSINAKNQKPKETKL